jgi:hypothetical protein
MLPEKTYQVVINALDTATDAMRAHTFTDEEDRRIYERLLQTSRRVCKRGKKAQALERELRRA